MPDNHLRKTSASTPVPPSTEPDAKPLRHPERWAGPVTSLSLHALFLIVAAWLVINPPIRAGDLGVEIEFATLTAEELSDLDSTPFDAIESPLTADLLKMETELADTFEADDTAVEVEAADPGSLDTLGGAGQDVEPGNVLSAGGGGGTSFFGIESRGSRFMFIVDISGSMSTESRISVLRVNLLESINALAEHTSYYVIAYNDAPIPISDSRRWIRASTQGKHRARTWVRNLSVRGGTEPSGAFEMAFRFKPRPDVIYFMTDGQDIDGLPEYIRQLNNKGRKTRINTITFGEQGSEEMMREIARDSGGKFTFVSSSGPGGGG